MGHTRCAGPHRRLRHDPRLASRRARNAAGVSPRRRTAARARLPGRHRTRPSHDLAPHSGHRPAARIDALGRRPLVAQRPQRQRHAGWPNCSIPPAGSKTSTKCCSSGPEAADLARPLAIAFDTGRHKYRFELTRRSSHFIRDDAATPRRHAAPRNSRRLAARRRRRLRRCANPPAIEFRTADIQARRSPHSSPKCPSGNRRSTRCGSSRGD